MIEAEKKVTGFGNCYYLKLNLFATKDKWFYCKKKQIYEFSCTKCPYKKRELRK